MKRTLLIVPFRLADSFLLLACLGCLVYQHAVRAAGFVANINFQRTNSASVTGYLPDAGFAFGDRGNGYAYGWSADNTANAFDRGQWGDKTVDTGNTLQPGGQSLVWEIAVPNGIYDVRLVAADPADRGGQGTRFNLNVEGTRAIVDGVPSTNIWMFGTNTHVQVRVADRRLTVSSGSKATNNCICFIEIKQVAPIWWGASIIDNSNQHKCPVDYTSESSPGVLGYFESHTGKRISMEFWGNGWSTSLSSQTNYMAKLWARGTIPFYSWEPSSSYSLSNIIAGTYDNTITTAAQTAKAYGKPFFLRFGHEMNGTWYSWSESNSINAGCPPGTFIAMWRHVHDIFKGVGCTNVAFVWNIDHYLTNNSHVVPLTRLYPGDDYVDWLGIDAYNKDTSTGDWFTNIYSGSYIALTNLAPNKPILVGEIATKNLSVTAKPAWIADTLAQLPSAFPNIRAFLWFNWNATDTNSNWPIEGGDNTLPYTTAPIDWASVSAFSNGIASPYYLPSLFTNQANVTASPAIEPVVILDAPTNVAAWVSNRNLWVSWSAVRGATNYNVYRSTSSSNGTFGLLMRTNGTNWADTTSGTGTAYYYVVTAENLAGESLDSARAGFVPGPPVILQAPLSQSALARMPVTFTVLAGGAPLLAYQWRFNGADLPGATAADLAIPCADPGDSGAYSVRVTNFYGSVLSAEAALSIVPLLSSGDDSFGQVNVSQVATNAIAIAAGAWHSLVLRGDGTLVAWGRDYEGQSDIPASLKPALAIAAGGYHSLALATDGTVRGWGNDDDGQTDIPSGLSNVIAIAAGTWHSLALRADGTLSAWGDNVFGQTNLPPGLSNVMAIAAGGNHNLALRANGTVAAWGENTDPKGNYAGQSVVPWDLANVAAIGAGAYHSLAARRDGTMVAWGYNSAGQCLPPANLTNVLALAAGGAHSVAIKADGTIVAWGEDWYGQCAFPPALSNVLAAAAGNAHTLLLVGAGRAAAPWLFLPACQGSQFSVSLQTLLGRNYALEYNGSLSATNWTTVCLVRGSGGLQALSDPSSAGLQRFYRVRTW